MRPLQGPSDKRGITRVTRRAGLLERRISGSGEGEQNWALFGGNGGSTVDSGGLTYVGIDWWTAGPSGQDVFSLGAGTGALAGLGAPQVNQDGVYKVSVFAGINGTAGDEFEVGLPGAFSEWTMLNTQAEFFYKLKLGDLDPTHAAKYVATEQQLFIGGSLSFAETAPWSSLFRVQQISGSGAFTVPILEILIELMSTDYDTSLSGGGVP
jgi:hypothetical protein